MADNAEPLVRLARYSDQLEAQEVVNLLRSHQISATATGGFTAEFQVGVPGTVDVFVLGRDVDEATEILRDIEHESNLAPEFDGSGVAEGRSEAADIGPNLPWGMLIIAEGGLALALLGYATGRQDADSLAFSFACGAALTAAVLWAARRVRR